MIDTIVLVIPIVRDEITNYEIFSPSAKGLFEQPFYKGACIKCIQFPSKADQTAKNYKLRLTLCKRVVNGGCSITLKVEFSAPKLLFGNNFQELEDVDFVAVTVKLHQLLLEQGVKVEFEKLKMARVKGVHFGKNIYLENAPSSLVINTIRKLNLSKRFDIGNTDYRNDGHSIRYHTNSYELTFYDKIKDLEQSKISEKRAIENDNLFNSSSLLSGLLTSKEVLRMEVRLNTARKLKEILSKVGCLVKTPTFNDVFSSKLAQKVLCSFWSDYISPSLFVVLLSGQSSQELYYQARSIGLSESKALQVVGALNIINEDSFRVLRKGLSVQAYYRVKTEFDKFEKTDSYLYDVFNQIQTDLRKMKAIRFLK